MAMAAAPEAITKTRPTISLWACFLFFIITAATVSSPALVKAGDWSRPSKLVIYVHSEGGYSNTTTVVSTPPAPASMMSIPFGSILLANNVLREGAAPDSLQVGFSLGLNAAGPGDSFYFSNVYVLTIGYSGSITVQGEASMGPGEVAVTGGTGDFRFARGYEDSVPVSYQGGKPSVFKSTFYLKYD